MKGNFSRISLPQNGVVAVSLYGHACRLSQGLFNTSFVFCFGQALPLCPSRALLRLELPPLAHIHDGRRRNCLGRKAVCTGVGQ